MIILPAGEKIEKNDVVYVEGEKVYKRNEAYDFTLDGILKGFFDGIIECESKEEYDYWSKKMRGSKTIINKSI